MIPILYKKSETDFNSNGIGFLVDCISSETTEERNSSYESTFTYPITGRLYEEITEGAIIKVKANETSDLQLFRIYKHSKPLNGVVTFNAEHISYDANGIPLLELKLKSATPAMAINKAITDGAFESKFKAWSDISTLNTINLTEPCSLRAALGGQEGSVLDVWGGEYEFDNYIIKLHAHRGSDNGVIIEYGKNLTDIKQDRNITETYTHLLPYAIVKEQTDNGKGETIDNEVIITLSEKVIPLNNAENIGHQKAYIINLSDQFSENETINEHTLKTKSKAYISAHPSLGTPNVNITASFIQLWQTEEYKNIAPLERVRLCDIVTIKFPKLGVSAKAKVIKTVFDSLAEKYKSIELGDAKSDFANTVLSQNQAISDLVTIVKKGFANATEELKEAIKNATNLITGNNGGFVVLHPAENPQEILILDTPDIESAMRVWRWNSSGLGYSSTGYNGTYSLAMTMDGAFSADFITTGTLNGALLRADSVSGNAISQGFKKSIENSITNARESVEQAFKVADEELRSSITTSYTDTISTTERTLKTLISQTQENIELSVSESLKNYPTKTEMNAAIKVTSDSITTAVNKKLNASDFGSYLQQNYNQFLLGFNGNNKVIQITAGTIGIYDGTDTTVNNRLARLNQNGIELWKTGSKVGAIGTNAMQGYDDYRGLVFDLEYTGKYMSWARKLSSNSSVYTTVLTYARAGAGYNKEGLYLGTDFYANGNKIDGANLTDTRADGYATYTGDFVVISKIEDKGNGIIEWTTTTHKVRNGLITS